MRCVSHPTGFREQCVHCRLRGMSHPLQNPSQLCRSEREARLCPPLKDEPAEAWMLRERARGMQVRTEQGNRPPRCVCVVVGRGGHCGEETPGEREVMPGGQPMVIRFQRWSPTPEPHVTMSRDQLLLLLLLTGRLRIAVVPQRKLPQVRLCCVHPGLQGAVLAQNCLHREAGIESLLFPAPPRPAASATSSLGSSAAQKRLRKPAKAPRFSSCICTGHPRP